MTSLRLHQALTIPTTLMLGKAQPSPSGTCRMLAKTTQKTTRGELGKNPFANPSVHRSSGDGKSLPPLLAHRRASIPQPFKRFFGVAKHREADVCPEARGVCAFKSTRAQQPSLPVGPKRVVSRPGRATDDRDFLADGCMSVTPASPSRSGLCK
jgi:hypothetical protein